MKDGNFRSFARTNLNSTKGSKLATLVIEPSQPSVRVGGRYRSLGDLGFSLLLNADLGLVSAPEFFKYAETMSSPIYQRVSGAASWILKRDLHEVGLN